MDIIVSSHIIEKAQYEIEKGTFDPSSLPEEQAYAIACNWYQNKIKEETERLWLYPDREINKAARVLGLSAYAIVLLLVFFSVGLLFLYNTNYIEGFWKKTLSFVYLLGVFTMTSFALESSGKRRQKALDLATTKVDSELTQTVKDFLRDKRPVKISCEC